MIKWRTRTLADGGKELEKLETIKKILEDHKKTAHQSVLYEKVL